eukprot:CAMPEP_0113512118 /NCGR_PEP_ID=MMETSP0014_2-20120614/39159_1 /TAXON_ID=2857 /ORGANISM="Nitzschia sp." /LENGTH=261 /DNA_ID=CAMNT_0000408435 /DNA_START=201 /DNA_END=982 /DNA_ORIENTATION=+ /assembly_acc=CAM_ASM_000159
MKHTIQTLSSFLLVAVSVGVTRAQLEDCTLCAGGEGDQKDDALTRQECTQIVTSIAGLLQSDDTCKTNQLQAFQAGCCDNPPFEYCTVCPDGSDFTLLAEVPTGVNPADNPTCQEAQFNPFLLSGVFQQEGLGDCSDTFLQRGAFYCGCPNTAQSCWLCPDKGPSGNPDRGDAWRTDSRCRGIEYLFSVFTAEECSELPIAFGVDFAAFCECGGVEERDEMDPLTSYDCSLCPGGGNVVDPNLVYSDPTDVFERNCGQAET